MTLADKNRRVAERCSSGVDKGVREQARREGKPHVGADMLPPGGQ